MSRAARLDVSAPRVIYLIECEGLCLRGTEDVTYYTNEVKVHQRKEKRTFQLLDCYSEWNELPRKMNVN